MPLKKIEKPVLASTWTFVIQKWKGHIGILTPKPKNIKKEHMLIKLFFLKLWLKRSLKEKNEKFFIKKITPRNTKKDPIWVQNKK